MILIDGCHRIKKKGLVIMEIRYTNLVGLLSLLGTIGGLVFAGIYYPSSAFISAVFILMAIVSFYIFLKFIYHFIKYSPYGDIPDEDAIRFYTDEEPEIVYKK
jgi:hypothetical protein